MARPFCGDARGSFLVGRCARVRLQAAHMARSYNGLMKSRIVAIGSVLAVVAWCTFIFVMSSQPADDSTELSMGVVRHIIGFIVPGYDQMSPADQLYWQQALDHPVRKTAHFLEYAVLGALMMNAVVQVMGAGGAEQAPSQETPEEEDAHHLPPFFSKPPFVAWVLATAFAAGDEVHQIFVPGRAGMVSDILIDSAGVLVGVLFAMRIGRLASRKNKQSK